MLQAPWATINGRGLQGAIRVPGMVQKRPEIILLAGMHRCGTSALARLLNLCGAVIPGSLLPASTHNPRGYWETAEAVAINIRALQSAGLEWNALFELDAAWYDSLAGRTFVAEARRFAAALQTDNGVLLIKDPRISLLASGWREAFEAAGFTVKFIIAYRDPREVAQSLASRQLLYVPHEAWPPERSYAIWLNYLLTLERASRGFARSFVDYGLVLNDWRTEFRRIRSDLSLQDQLKENGVETEIDAFLTKDLRNARSSGSYEGGGVVGQALGLLQASSLGSKNLNKRFDAVYAAFSEARQMFGGLAAELQSKNESLAGQPVRPVLRTASWGTPSWSAMAVEEDEGLSVRHQALLKTYAEMVSSSTREREDAASAARRLRLQGAAATTRLSELEMQKAALEDRLQTQLREAEAEQATLEERLEAQIRDLATERSISEERLEIELREVEAQRDVLKAELQELGGRLADETSRATTATRLVEIERSFQKASMAVEAGRLREEIVSAQLSARRAVREHWREEYARLVAEHQTTREALTEALEDNRAVLAVLSQARTDAHRESFQLRYELEARMSELEAFRVANTAIQKTAIAELDRVLRSKSWQLTRPFRGLRRRLKWPLV